jgi:hypothetical protein
MGPFDNIINDKSFFYPLPQPLSLIYSEEIGATGAGAKFLKTLHYQISIHIGITYIGIKSTMISKFIKSMF